jgi:hypothetical protein
MRGVMPRIAVDQSTKTPKLSTVGSAHHADD